MVDENRSQILTETKDFLVECYNYCPERIFTDYPINLTDGSIEIADLVVTTKKEVPFMVIFVTAEEIPEDKIKRILTKSKLIYGIARKLKGDSIPEFWGIRKRWGVFKNFGFEQIIEYPNSVITSGGIIELFFNLFSYISF